MTETSDSARQRLSPSVGGPRPFLWSVGAIVGSVIAAIVAINLPDRLKLLGLFPLIWAGLIGIGLRWWADHLRVSVFGWPTLAAGLLIAAGEVGMVLGGWLVFRTELTKQFEKIPTLQSSKIEFNGVPDTLQRQKDHAASDANTAEIKSRRELEAELNSKVRERQQVQLQLSTFLYRRIRRLGDFPAPWPQLFWCCEVAFGTLVGVWCLRRIRIYGD